MATIKDIALKVGVSSAAVSRVLNYDKDISVSEETRNAIFKVAEELKYKKKKVYPPINNVAILNWVSSGEEVEDMYYKSICEEMVAQAAKRNILVTQINKGMGIEAVPNDIEAFIGIGKFWRKEVMYLKQITPNGVFVDTSPDEHTYDSVRPNLNSIMNQMCNYFVDKGHTKIGFVGVTDMDIDNGQSLMDLREWSFRESMTYYKRLNEDYIFITEDLTVNAGYSLGIKCIEKLGDELPTAFCLASDTLAIGFLQALNEKNIVIPDRVAVFSINNSSISQYVSPPLSTYHIDVPIMCDTTLSLLQERVLKKRDITKTIYINGKQVLRKSC